jgi:hypothetical protein
VFAFIKPSCDVRVVFVFEITVLSAFCVAEDMGLF